MDAGTNEHEDVEKGLLSAVAMLKLRLSLLA